ncbi:50S ribosomal protein L1P, partial [mine drainage metagenome]
MAERSSLEVVQEVLEKAPPRGFGETVELTVNLKDLDLTVPKNRIEDDMPLPNGRGKSVKVALFGTPEMCQKVKGVVDLAVSSADLDDV